MGVTQVVIIAAIVIFVIGRRFAGMPVGARTITLPIIVSVWGVTQMSGHKFDAVGIVLLAVEAVVALGAGALRAVTIKLYVREGHLWQRYQVTTLAVWVGMLGVRFGFIALATALHASLPATGAMIFSLGLTLIAEVLLVTRRAAATGVPIMPNDRRRVGARM